jgi:hypothetical protein
MSDPLARGVPLLIVVNRRYVSTCIPNTSISMSTSTGMGMVSRSEARMNGDGAEGEMGVKEVWETLEPERWEGVFAIKVCYDVH